MGDPTKLVLGELVNDLLSEGRVLRDMARQDLAGHTIEARVFFEGEPKARFEAAGTIEHIKVDAFGDDGVKRPVRATITFRGKEKSQNGEENKDRLHQLGIGSAAINDYSAGYRLVINIYSPSGGN